MSQPFIHHVTCPECGNARPVTAWGSINASIDPALRAALLNGQMEIFYCDSCRKLLRLAFDTLYHDMQRQFMIQLAHQGDPSEPPDKRLPRDYRFRTVRTMPSLIEKVCIFEDGFDDRLIELFKVALWSSVPPQQRGSDGRLYYAGIPAANISDVEFLVVHPDRVERLRVSIEEQIAPFQKRFSTLLQTPPPPHMWLTISEEYATAILTTPQSFAVS
jgi:hypothetical protein